MSSALVVFINQREDYNGRDDEEYGLVAHRKDNPWTLEDFAHSTPPVNIMPHCGVNTTSR